MGLDIYLETAACPHCGKSDQLHWQNITHNLNQMAAEAGIYQHVWRPEEMGINTAGELVEPLRNGIALMESDPDRFSAFDAPNGWGLYVNFVPWLRQYLKACEANPSALVRVSR